MMVNGNRGMFSNAKNHAAALGQQNDASQSPADSYGVCAESYAALVWSAMPLCHRQRQLEAVQACRSAPGCCAMCSCLRSLQGLTLQSEAVLASLLAHSQHQVLQQLSQQLLANTPDLHISVAPPAPVALGNRTATLVCTAGLLYIPGSTCCCGPLCGQRKVRRHWMRHATCGAMPAQDSSIQTTVL
eukprot:18248-Heterococcus_DN1.PRE.4